MLKLLQQRAAPDQLAHLLHSNAVAVANIIYTVAPGEFTVLVFFWHDELILFQLFKQGNGSWLAGYRERIGKHSTTTNG
jgi:hypothetical protein